ncbi:MAG: hypothetical protein J1F32_01530 [Erysipelotrichales bacterium]|nr:hypothetical protein [Erysipelotrichales bacterium]
MQKKIMTEIPFNEMHRLISDIFVQIKGMRIRHYQNPEEVNVVFREGEESYNYLKEHKTEQNKLLFNVHQALFSLDEEDRKLIIGEFYETKPLWWMNYYSRSTYYRKQRKAMRLFLYFYGCSV